MTDAREALVARQRDEYGASWDVLVPEVGWTLGRIIESVIEGVLAAGWTLPEEGKQPGCTGAGDCPATAHTHGCYADTEGHCEHPEEHRWTPPTVKPSVEDVARTLWETDEQEAETTGGALGLPWAALDSLTQHTYRADAKDLLALPPGRTEAEVKAEALREAASAAVTVEEGIPWDHDHDRATVSAWLLGLADRIEKGEGRG